MKRHELDQLVIKLVRQRGSGPDITLRDLADEVQAHTGYNPSTSVLDASLKRIGLVSKGHRWLWRHNPPKGE